MTSSKELALAAILTISALELNDFLKMDPKSLGMFSKKWLEIMTFLPKFTGYRNNLF